MRTLDFILCKRPLEVFDRMRWSVLFSDDNSGCCREKRLEEEKSGDNRPLLEGKWDPCLYDGCMGGIGSGWKWSWQNALMTAFTVDEWEGLRWARAALNTWKKEVTIDQDGKNCGRSKFLVEISSLALNMANGCWEILNTQVWKPKQCPLAEVNFPRMDTLRT